MTEAGPGAPVVSRAYAAYALALLTLINLLNYLDRNVIFAVFEPIKRDLALTDAQLGWLGSAYVLVFSLAALPFGVVSDLRSRRAVIAWGVAIWSLFTVLSGFAQGFVSLFICRAMVGIGEAAFGAAAASMVADYYPGRGRAVALGILAAGLVLGGGLGIWLGGQLGAAYGWRVAFVVVGIPGLFCALLAARLVDPTRPARAINLRRELRALEVTWRRLLRQVAPLLIGVGGGLVAARILHARLGEDSAADAMVLAVLAGLGATVNIIQWVRQQRRLPRDAAPFGSDLQSALSDMLAAARLVLRTPTLGFIFLAGALISFGMNGLVGWAPTFVQRELGVDAGAASQLLGWRLLVFGLVGTLAGGFVADQLRRVTAAGRVLAVAAGMIAGGALATWLLTLRDPALFKPVFSVAVFFLTWYNGPISAAIFDVVPSRVSATVAGTYLLFIHLAGDAIALPLVGALSDRFGLAHAILLLPLMGLAGGVVVLGAARTCAADRARVAALHPAP